MSEIYEIQDVEFNFKYKDQIHTLRELTISEVREAVKEAEDMTEMDFHAHLLCVAGLKKDIVESMTYRQIQKVMELMQDAKK